MFERYERDVRECDVTLGESFDENFFERLTDDVTTKNWGCSIEMTRTRLWQKAATTPFFQNVVVSAKTII